MTTAPPVAIRYAPRFPLHAGPKFFYELKAEQPALTPEEYAEYVKAHEQAKRQAARAAKKRSEVAERAWLRGRLRAAQAAGKRWPAAWEVDAALSAPKAPRELHTGNSSPPVFAEVFDGEAVLEPVSLRIPAFKRVAPSPAVLALKGDDLLWYITEAVRPFGRERQAKCMHTFVGHGFKADEKMADESKQAPEVWVETGKDGAATGGGYFVGLMNCCSDNECPRCMSRARAETAEQVTMDVAAREKKNGKGSVGFLTTTVRHKLSDDGKKNRDGVMRAWARVQSGEPWRRFCKQHGLLGGHRAIELTYRLKNEDGTDGGGWHPHIHTLLFFDHVPESSEWADMQAWIHERWKRAVVSVLGEKHKPDDKHGTVLTDCHKADYLSKLGLKPEKDMGRELSSTGITKKLSKSRSPIQIAADFALYRDPADALLWMEACDIMRGTKVLHPFGDAELPKVEEVEQQEATGRTLVYSFDAWTWERIRNVEFAKPAVLKAARHGREAVEKVVAELLLKAPPADARAMRNERRQC